MQRPAIYTKELGLCALTVAGNLLRKCADVKFARGPTSGRHYVTFAVVVDEYTRSRAAASRCGTGPLRRQPAGEAAAPHSRLHRHLHFTALTFGAASGLWGVERESLFPRGRIKGKDGQHIETAAVVTIK